MKHKTKTMFVIGLGTAIIGGFILPANAYSPDKTHAPLAGRSVELHNSFYPSNSLSEQEKGWIMWGAEHEDYGTRPMNHFYDPINNKGLVGFLASKIWVHNSAAQSAVGGDHTWEEALNAYKKGDREKAYRALGHVIHLIQDAAVPAHTRNDPHPHGDFVHGGSDPLEQGAKEFQIPPAAGLSPVTYPDLDAYFENVASYTNTHFYSKDSVGFYENPIPIRMDDKYVYGRDVNGEYRLIGISGNVSSDLGYQDITVLDFHIDNSEVLQDYWNRLAPLSVENGAGVIKLFHDSAEEEVVVNEQKISFWDKTKNFFSNTAEATASIGDWMDGFGKFLVSSIQRNSTPRYGETSYLITSPSLGYDTNVAISLTTEEENQQAQQNFYNQLQNIALTGVGTVPTPVAGGEADDTTDETNEIDTTDEANNSNTTDATDSTQDNKQTHFVTRVIDGDTIELQNGERVRYVGVNTPEEPNGCFAPEATAYNEALVLNKTVTLEQGPDDTDDYGRLLRYVYTENTFVNQDLVATGHAYAFDYGFTHEFTDKFEEIEEEAKENRRGLWGDACHPEEGEVLGDSTENNSSSGSSARRWGPVSSSDTYIEQPNIPPEEEEEEEEEGAEEGGEEEEEESPSPVINEVQIADTEFIELYNPADAPADLSGYHLAYYSSTRENWKDDPEDDIDPDGPVSNKQFPDGAEIGAGGYYLIGLKDFPETPDTPKPDWEPTFTSLSNSNGTVAIFSEDPEAADTTEDAEENTEEDSEDDPEEDPEEIEETESEQDPGPIDAVGWGDDEEVTLKETQTAPAPQAGQSISRDESHADTDDNSADFTEQDPTLQNNSGEVFSALFLSEDAGNWELDWEVTIEVDDEDVLLPAETYHLEGQLTNYRVFLNASNATDHDTPVYGGGSYGPFGELATSPTGSLLRKSCDGTTCSFRYMLSAFHIETINAQPAGTDIWICVTSIVPHTVEKWWDFYTANGDPPSEHAYRCKHIVK